MRKHSALVALSAFFASVTLLIAQPASPVSATTCQESGEGCAVGMTGPRGGIIFYDAGSQQWWGRFLEAERVSTLARAPWGGASSIFGNPGNVAAQRQSMAIGMGRFNSARMAIAGSPLIRVNFAADQDWYLPSKDELDALFDYWKIYAPAGVNYFAVPVWTSSESEDAFAWYQLFHDGTQFTDANGIIPRLSTNKSYLLSARHVGSTFSPAQMRIIRVRSFPYRSEQPPAPTLVNAPVENPSCSQAARNCRVGDVGPGGGIVVYDAGSDQRWGRYLEVAPKSCESSRVPFSTRGSSLAFSSTERVLSKAIGEGRRNTLHLLKVVSQDSAFHKAISPCNGLTDWFLPSKGELNEAFRWLSHSRKGLNLTPVGQFERGYYWTSSDYNGRNAWTQYMADGQQFDRVQSLTGNKKPPARPFYVRPMRAFAEGQMVATVGSG